MDKYIYIYAIPDWGTLTSNQIFRKISELIIPKTDLVLLQIIWRIFKVNQLIHKKVASK